ncbi:hypothetical protein CEXT_690671 [Caerostris extrusa]|uniref:Uncharacterized protein n=1 Tax=Caerostris extrusa TaxID=172846 RepID=A0AAV4SZL0_CAEEX|nr:hypothetical protein CEXT_690671 [Caerostris extrusa]
MIYTTLSKLRRAAASYLFGRIRKKVPTMLFQIGFSLITHLYKGPACGSGPFKLERWGGLSIHLRVLFSRDDSRVCVP